MSLLMDALKKAEQEKKEAAKRLKEAKAQDGEGKELELAEDEVIDLTAASKQETQEAEIPEEGSESLTLEAISPEADSVSNDLEASEEVTVEHPEFPAPEFSATEEVKAVDETEGLTFDPKQTFALANLDIEKSSEAEEAFADEDTVQVQETEQAYAAISGGRTVTTIISAAELAKDMGSGKDQPTPVAAQTVFTAIGTGSEKEGYKWVVFLVSCIVVAIAFFVIDYNVNTEPTSKLSSPLVAQGVETDSESLPIVEIPEEILQVAITSETQDEALQAESGDAGTLSDMETGIATEEERKDEVIIESDLPVASVEKESTFPTVELIPEDVAAIVPGITGKEMPAMSVSKKQMLPEDIEVEPAAIKISRSKAKGRQDELINTAYSEYIQGNYSLAETSYQKILNTKPDNRDALLGLAAIAYIKGDIQSAYTYYSKVLKLYPRDSIARTALINMQSGNKPEQSESAIKLMLQQEPETAFLYFTLGNIYAAQARWAEAQQAFFDAYRLESSNSDYAFNLAVSLEHIGQIKTALDYYNVALQLADNTMVNFNTAIVLARIDALSAAQSSLNK